MLKRRASRSDPQTMTRHRAALLAVAIGFALAAAWNAVRLTREHDARPASRVSDEAGLLGDYVPVLEWGTASWWEDLGIDFHVVALRDPDTPSEELAQRVFHARRVGVAAPTGGILLLLNGARREARIEVSYQLEGALNDALLGDLVRDQLVPYVSYRHVGMAVMDVVHLLKDVVLWKVGTGALDLDEAFRQRPFVRDQAAFLSGGAGARSALPSRPVDGDHKARVPDARRADYAPAADPGGSVQAFLRATRDLAGDPSLELFTPGSRVMRERYPVAPFEELQRYRRLVASQPLRLVVEGDRAVATSDAPAPGFVPVLLHRMGGTWRVDLVETWKNLFFDRRGSYVQVNTNNPYAFGLHAFGSHGSQDLGPVDLGGRPLPDALADLEGRGDALSHFLLAEILFRNCFVALDAIEHYDTAVRLAPEVALYRSTLQQRRRYLGFGPSAPRSDADPGAAARARRCDAATACDAGWPGLRRPSR